MDDLIKVFNALHEINKHLKLNPINLPQIVVIGAQSSGKSSVLESIVGCDFLPKGTGTVTRCPLRLQLINDYVEDNDFTATFTHLNKSFTNFDEITKEIQTETQRKIVGNKAISEEEIVLEMIGPDFPTLTFVDLPGFLKVTTADQPKDLESRIENLARKYISPENSIILAISPANVDIATSEAIKIARDYDSEGRRTFHVLTKLDIMDEGTSALELLTDSSKLKSQAVIGVVNRSQHGVQNKIPISKQREKERGFLSDNYPNIYKHQGTEYLIETLVLTLKNALKQYLPKLKREVDERIKLIKDELALLDPKDKKEIVLHCLLNFQEFVRQILDGSLEEYGDEIEGGAKVSVELYTTFFSKMGDVSMDNIDNAAIELALKNTGGVRDTNFALDKAFALLMKKEIKKFQEPVELTLQTVRMFVMEFIDDALQLSHISTYPNLLTEMKILSDHVITVRWKKTERLIQDYILCERNDITFTNPYKQLLQELSNCPLIPGAGTADQYKAYSIEEIAATVRKIGLKAPIPQYYPYIIQGIHCCGYGQTFEHELKKASGDPQKIIMDVIDAGIGLESRKLEVYDYITRDIAEFGKQYFKCQKKDVDIGTSKNGIVDSQSSVIKRLLILYFDMVRNNITNFVPKATQTFLIKDLSVALRAEMDRRISLDDSDSYVTDDGQAMRIHELRNDLEKLEDMRRRFDEKW